MIRLSRRMRTIADLSALGLPVTDVGTDHAYIPITLMEEGSAPSALASDINAGPLERARANIEEAGLSGLIRTELCDGVPEDAPFGLLILAGMGGLLMSRILKQAEASLSRFSVIVAEPQSDNDMLRRTLYELGFYIETERMLKEDGKYYACIRARQADDREAPGGLSEEEMLYGPCLIAEKNAVLLEYLERRQRILEGILSQMRSGGKTESSDDYRKISHEFMTARRAAELMLPEKSQA